MNQPDVKNAGFFFRAILNNSSKTLYNEKQF